MGAYLSVETSDQLVRLNIGAIPDEVDIPDWAILTGDLLYLLVRSGGEVRYVHVPLDAAILGSIRASGVNAEQGIYRAVNGEPTFLAFYLALVFLDRDVCAEAIRRELGMSVKAMSRVLELWQCTAGLLNRSNLLQLIRLLTFERNGRS